MALPQQIILVGMPGSGKSTLGKRLAALLSCPFVDLDEVIEKQENSLIKDIFRHSGEDQFRMIEHFALASTLGRNPRMVMATGGGTPRFHDNMDLINARAVSVFLDTPMDKIVSRIHANEDRPLIVSDNIDELREEMTQVYADRLPYYQKATYTTDKQTPEAILALVKS
ncbi:MAG: shikimate kinase [Cyclobacteriaceae bacterium]